MSATIRDVAKEANVSVTTVSRVINNQPLVSEETRQRVLDAIDKLGFHPNAVARSLVNKKTHIVGLLIPDISNSFFSEVVRGMEDVASMHDYHVILCNTDQQLLTEARCVEVLREKQVDGLIFMSEQVTPQHESVFESSRLPVVLASTRDEHGRFPAVYVDGLNSSQAAVEHLISLGHTRIACISGPLKDLIAGKPRFDGYRQALAKFDIPFDPKLAQEGDFRFESGYRAMKRILQLPNPPTAVFAGSDEMAAGAINAALDSGLSVPGEISVVGFDNIRLAGMIRPKLTTIAQPMYEMGATAMGMLVEVMAGRVLKKTDVMLPGQLIIRDSTGPRR